MPKPLEQLTDARRGGVEQRLRGRFNTALGAKVAVAVTAGAAFVDVVFSRPEPDLTYGVAVTPNWLTTFAVPDAQKTLTGCRVTFGTVAPASAAVSLLAYRHDSA